MLKQIVTLLLLLIGAMSYAQDSMIYEFNFIEESVYNYDLEKFESIEQGEGSGKIKIYFKEKALVIDSETSEDDKKLRIIEKSEKEGGTMYICAMNGQYYAFSISENNKELTLVSADYRFVYRLK